MAREKISAFTSTTSLEDEAVIPVVQEGANYKITAANLANYVDENISVLRPASNLSDVASASSARTNLGLGTAATANVGGSSGDVTPSDLTALTAASDVQDADLLATYRSTGPLKKLTALVFGNWVVKTLTAFIQSGSGAVARTPQGKMQERVSAFDFMTAAQIADVEARTLTLDVTTALQAAIDACIVSGKALHLPAGNYKITSTLNLVGSGPAYGLNIFGEGRRYTTITLHTASTTVAALTISVPDNSSFIGGHISGIGIVCNGGAAKGRGIRLATTATNSAISQTEIDNISIVQTSTGISKTGVIYMSTFRNITITGSVTEYGIHATTAQEIIYNTYADIEVTGVESTGYAYWLQVAASQLRNLTADGCIYISNPYGCAKGVTIEGIAAAATPTTSAIVLNQCDSLEDVALINIPNSKCSIGINVTGRCNITNVRWPDAGAGNQPGQPLYLNPGSKGIVIGYQTGRAVTSKVEAGSAAADVANWTFINSADITDYDLSCSSGTWTPSFSADFTTTPSVVSATWSRVGRQVTVSLYCIDGVLTAGGVITGLPFTCAAGTGFAVAGSSNDSSERLSGSIIGGTAQIGNIPANTLTGNFWQLTGTYQI